MTVEAMCVICGKARTAEQAEDEFCYGCNSIIYEEHGDAPWGGHDSDEHGEEDDE